MLKSKIHFVLLWSVSSDCSLDRKKSLWFLPVQTQVYRCTLLSAALSGECQANFSPVHSKFLWTESSCISTLTNAACFLSEDSPNGPLPVWLGSLWLVSYRKAWKTNQPILILMHVFRYCPPQPWAQDTAPLVTFPSIPNKHRETGKK